MMNKETVTGLFEATVGTFPDAIAVSCGGLSLNYAELDTQASQLALHLRSLGVKEGSFVGVALKRSPEFIVSILGILKAGGAYVPLPAEYPLTRLSLMIEQSDIQVLITDPDSPVIGVTHGLKQVAMESDAVWRKTPPGPLPRAKISAESPAYVMFTSGSTGIPKGVVVPHRAIISLFKGQEYARFGISLRCLLLSPTAFDASTFELWSPLINGGTCVISPDRPLDLQILRDELRQERINCLWLTASLFNAIIDQDPKILETVAHVLCGGESLSMPHVRIALETLPSIRLTNCYGPTEGTTFTTTYELTQSECVGMALAPVGMPLNGRYCHIVDENFCHVAEGTVGELLIGGEGLALGYLNQPELTSERFVPDHFSKTCGASLYRTGDLAKRLSGGDLVIVGRIDDQVKIRGFRVEPGEVESVLRLHPDVAQAVVVVLMHLDGTKELRACVVPNAGKMPSVSELRGHLEASLPHPMVPKEWVLLERIPLLPSGKADRISLASLELKNGSHATSILGVMDHE